MKWLLLLTLLTLYLSAFTCEGRRRGFDSGRKTGGKHHLFAKPSKNATDKAPQKDDDISKDTPVELVEATDMADKVVFAGDDFPVRNRKGGKRKGQRPGKGNFWKQGKPMKKCRTMEESLGLICGEMFAKLSIKKRDHKKEAVQEKLGKVLECCKLTNESDALGCYQKVRLERLNNFCSLKNDSNDCCAVEDEDRISCFEKSKLERCENVHERNATDKIKKKGKGGQFNEAKQCCRAGTEVDVGRGIKNAYKTCKSSYSAWVDENDITKAGMCYKKYVFCCIHQKSRGGRFPGVRKNVDVDLEDVTDYKVGAEEITPELPDETGQAIEVTMTMPTVSVSLDNEVCCTHGKEKGSGLSGMGQKFECLRGSRQLKKKYGAQCSTKYMECCMESKRSSKGHGKPIKNPADKRYSKGEMPDGLRRSPSGHYYYVDKIHPDLKRKRNRGRVQKMKDPKSSH